SSSHALKLDFLKIKKCSAEVQYTPSDVSSPLTGRLNPIMTDMHP
ncbi:hypothetical protein LINGRAHAP2_LOCUS33156, partial [Linum grandiflorum]